MRYWSWLVVSVLCGLPVIVWANARALVCVACEEAGVAVAEAAKSIVSNPLGTAMLLLPFVTAAALAAVLQGKEGSLAAGFFFGAGIMPLPFLYAAAFKNAELCMLNHQWTAAALSLGLICFVSLPVVVAAQGAAFLIVRLLRLLKKQ